MFAVCQSAARFVLVMAGLGLFLSGAHAQYPDASDQPAQVEPAGSAKVEPAAAAKEEELTPEELAEREQRKACKVAICAAFHRRAPGEDISCNILKSWRKEQLDKVVSKTRVSWPWGKVRCSAEVKLERDMLTKALNEEKFVASVPLHQVACTVDRGKDEPAEITLELAPKVTFEKGKATKVALNWGKVDGPKLVKSAIWTATATDNTFNVMQTSLVEDINDFIGKKCDEVRADWDGK